VGYRCTAPFMGWNMACTVVLFSAVSPQCHRPDTGQPECLALSRSAFWSVAKGVRFGAGETTVQPRSRSMVFSSSKIASRSKLRLRSALLAALGLPRRLDLPYTQFPSNCSGVQSVGSS
jgi:hypothetical protein